MRETLGGHSLSTANELGNIHKKRGKQCHATFCVELLLVLWLLSPTPKMMEIDREWLA